MGSFYQDQYYQQKPTQKHGFVELLCSANLSYSLNMIECEPLALMDTPIKASRRALLFLHLPSSVL